MTQTTEQLVEQGRKGFAMQRAVDAQAALDEIIACVGVDGMTNLLRWVGYNVEPSQVARMRVLKAVERDAQQPTQ